MKPVETGSVDQIDVAYVANLARLYLDEDEVRTFQAQLDDIVGYVHQLRELDLDGVEPASHARLLANVFRADEVRPGLAQEIVLANAPERTRDQFKVPRIVE